MPALGLTQGQIAIGTTKYSGIYDLGIPGAAGQRIVHTPSLSTVFPTKEMGHLPGVLSGRLRRLTGANLIAFIAAVRTGTSERKVSFLIGGTECYVYTYSGDIDAPVCTHTNGLPTASDRLYEVGFSFPLSRSKVYNASDDTVLWGS